MITCTKCGEMRETTHCKNCNRLKTQRYREKNRDKINEKRREERKKTKEFKFIGANNNHKKEEINDNEPKLLTPAMLKKIEDLKDEKKVKEMNYRKEYYQKNKERELARGRAYKQKNAEDISIKRKKYLADNKEYVKQRYRKYCVNNREKIAEISRNYRTNNISVKLRNTFRSRILESINKGKLTEEYLDTTIERVMIWLKYNFNDYMDWDNYGTVWNIDHTIPINKFDLKKEEDIFICFNWRNLMPMYTKDNISKHNKIKPFCIFNQEYKLRSFIAEINDDDESVKTEEYLIKYSNIIRNNNLFKVVPNTLNKV
jgi:hypothetical protein